MLHLNNLNHLNQTTTWLGSAARRILAPSLLLISLLMIGCSANEVPEPNERTVIITVSSEMTGGDDEDEKFIIEETVINESGTPIQNVLILLFDEVTFISETTDENGKAQLSVPAEGWYTLELYHQGTLMYSEHIEILPGTTIRIDVI